MRRVCLCTWGRLEVVAVPRSFGALVLPRLLGPAGHEWLGQQPEALLEVAAHFRGEPSGLRTIAADAAARVGMPVVPPFARVRDAGRELGNWPAVGGLAGAESRDWVTVARTMGPMQPSLAHTP